MNLELCICQSMVIIIMYEEMVGSTMKERGRHFPFSVRGFEVGSYSNLMALVCMYVCM